MSFQSSSYSVRSSTAGPARYATLYDKLSASLPVRRAASTYGGAGGQGTRISSVAYSGVRSGAPGGSFSSSVQVSGSGGGAICTNEKAAMQHLNDRLATYLETVRNLEQANNKLEVQIREFLEKRGPDVNDYSRYNAILEDLRKKVRRAGWRDEPEQGRREGGKEGGRGGT